MQFKNIYYKNISAYNNNSQSLQYTEMPVETHFSSADLTKYYVFTLVH